MDEFNKQIKKVMWELETLVGIVEDNENIKEYLIECNLWDEDYSAINNGATIVTEYAKEY